MKTLMEHRPKVPCNAPYIPEMYDLRQTDLVMSSVKLTEEFLKEQDGVIIITAHSNIDYKNIVYNSYVVIDSVMLFPILEAIKFSEHK